MKLVILDRDGVINYDSEDYIKSPEEWRPIPGSLEAISLLNSDDFTVTLATNQSGIGRGLYTRDKMHAIHRKMRRHANPKNAVIDSIFYCPHHPDEGCDCRKPRPGLLLNIAKYYDISLENVFFVGDSVRDLQAAVAAKAQPVLVCTGNGTKAKDDPFIQQHHVPIFDDLMAFARNLCPKEPKIVENTLN